MIKLLLLGALAGAFFSSTFLLNEAMSLQGGHWVWSASLRYVFMTLFLMVIILTKVGLNTLISVFRLFIERWRFWVVSGSIGFGGFYALICYSADFSPGWVIAATWQFTVVASLFVFKLFGRSFPGRIWIISSLIFIGVVLVNLSHFSDVNYSVLISGGLPILLAAFCYPFGNQLVWEVQHGSHPRLPKIISPLLDHVYNRVFLMTLGSLPLWVILIAIVQPPPPSFSQAMNTSLVALFSGILATGIFLFARNLAVNSNELAGVDATQASEVIFALIGGMVFLDSKKPDMVSFSGLALILVGLSLFVKYQKT